MFNGKLSRLVVNQKKTNKDDRHFVLFVKNLMKSIVTFHTAPYHVVLFIFFIYFNKCLCWTVICYGHNIWLIYQIASLLSTFMKIKRTLHEWFNVNLDVNSTWFELGFCCMNFAWNVYTCKSSKNGTIIKCIDSIGKKAPNTLWMLFCCTSNSKINCKFNMNLLANSCLMMWPLHLGFFEICLNRCCSKSNWTIVDYVVNNCEWLSILFFHFVFYVHVVIA